MSQDERKPRPLISGRVVAVTIVSLVLLFVVVLVAYGLIFGMIGGRLVSVGG